MVLLDVIIKMIVRHAMKNGKKRQKKPYLKVLIIEVI